MEYVFDTEPIVAFLYCEPGHEDAADRLAEIESGAAVGSMAEVTASEVFYLVARIEGVDGSPTAGSFLAADRDLRTLIHRGLELRRADWRLAGEIKSHGGVSLADSYGIALASERDATFVVGADDDFDDLPVDVEIHRIRDEPG